MVRAWYLREEGDWDRKETGMMAPPRFVEIDQVCRESGVRYLKVDADNFENSQALADLKKEFNIGNQDIMEVNASLPPEMFEKLYKEHLHTADEIRLVLEGSAYFDIRDVENHWVRIEAEKGDMVILPPGLYHRFTVTAQTFVRVKRLFVGHVEWCLYNRDEERTDTLMERQDYINRMTQQCAA